MKRRDFTKSLVADVIVPLNDGTADLGDEQFQRLNAMDEFSDCIFEDIVPGDIVRRAREPDSAFFVDAVMRDADPPGFTATHLVRFKPNSFP